MYHQLSSVQNPSMIPLYNGLQEFPYWIIIPNISRVVIIQPNSSSTRQQGCCFQPLLISSTLKSHWQSSQGTAHLQVPEKCVKNKPLSNVNGNFRIQQMELRTTYGSTIYIRLYYIRLYFLEIFPYKHRP